MHHMFLMNSCHLSAIGLLYRKYFSSSTANMKRLFESSDHAKSYTQFRPIYPQNVLDTVLKYHKLENHGFDSALDIGCGSGQSTVQLLKYFENVTGMDVSEAQISQAPKDLPKVNFIVGQAENLTCFPENSINLITVAQAMHWMDTEKFYSEASRVLKTNGTLAVYGYGNLTLNKSEAINLVCKEFYSDLLKKGGYWDVNRQHIDDLYTNFKLPFRDFQRIDHISMEKEWTVHEFIGYVSSWSGYVEYMKKNPGSTVLEDMSARLKNIYQSDGNEEPVKLKVTWPIFILLGKK